MKNRFLKLFIIIGFIFGLTLSAFAFSFRNMTLDFIQISDTHITSLPNTTYKSLFYSKNLLKDAIDQINELNGLDFVLFTGDMVDSANEKNYEDFYSLVSNLKYPHLYTFGSHDYAFGALGKEEVLDIVRKNNPNYTFDDTYYAFSPKTDYRIIVLDPVLEGKNSSNGELPNEQLRFLDEELAQNQDKVVVIAMHYPSVEPFISKEHSLLNANAFNEILLKYKNPIVVLSGHYHASKIKHWGNLVFVSTPSTVTYPMAFRHIKIINYKDRVEYKFDFISTRLDDIKEANRQSVISYATLAGYESDRTTTFTYLKKHPKSASYKRNKIKNANKVTKTSKRELKKLTQPQKVKKEKTKKESITKDKNEKETTIKTETKKEKRKIFNFERKNTKKAS